MPSNYPYPDDVIYNANEIEFGCPQSDFLNENCLIVTVYTPYVMIKTKMREFSQLSNLSGYHTAPR